jgi:hypothetical protein
MRKLIAFIVVLVGIGIVLAGWNQHNIQRFQEMVAKIPPSNSTTVNVLDRRWITGIPIYGPTRVWVVDGPETNRVSRPNTTQLDETGPEGITWGPGNPLPPVHLTKVPVNPHYPYLALLGKTYKQVAGYWVPDAEQFLIGREAILCPTGQDGQKRELAARINTYTCLGRLCSDMVDNDLRGGYTIQFEKVDTSLCDPSVNNRQRIVFLR